MNVSPDEARSALAAVREVEERARRAIGLAGGGPIVMIWGVVWLIGYLGGYFLVDEQKGILWGLVDLLGIAGTLFVVSRLTRRVRDPIGPRIGLLWLLLILYGSLWIWIARPESGLEIGMLAATMAMFGYVVLGLWIDLVFLWIGLGVTVLSIALYLLAPETFEIWMGLLGGGALLLSGAYIHRNWR